MTHELATENPIQPIARAVPASSSRSVANEPPSELLFRRRLRLGEAMREIVAFRNLILTLAERDLRARYKQALLGAAWALLTPLMLMVVFTLVFTHFTKVHSGDVPYPIFAYVALIPWTFFNSAVSSGGSSLINNVALLNKVYCPREVFPIAALFLAAFDAALSIVVLVILFAVEGFAPHIQLFYTPILLVVGLAFTLAVTLLASVMLVYLRDLRYALPLILQFAMFATPVAYGMEAIAHTRSMVLLYSGLNPLAPVIDGLRRTILHGLQPDWQALGIAMGSASLLLAVSYYLFKRLETGMADIA